MPEDRAEKQSSSPANPLDATAFAAPEREVRARPGEDLHICPSCACKLVYPIDWSPAGRHRWSVSLRCPDCEWHDAGIFDQDVVDRFDEALDVGTEQLLDDLNLLARANMEEQVERFVAAIWSDQVLPEDF